MSDGDDVCDVECLVIPISLYSNLLLFPFGAGISATPFSSVMTLTRRTPPGVLGTGGSPGSDVTGGV